MYRIYDYTQINLELDWSLRKIQLRLSTGHAASLYNKSIISICFLIIDYVVNVM